MYALSKVIEKVQQAVAPLVGAEPTELEVRLNDKPELAADLAVPCFAYAKKLGQSPIALAETVAVKLGEQKLELFTTITAVKGFVNFQLNWPAMISLILADFAKPEAYGSQTIGEGKVVVTDFSSPNIAKPFSVGHLRSTVIGDAINNLHRALGYTVIGDNHLGDWGTQFGKLIVAYQKWGDKEKVEANPIPELRDLYVRFHTEVEGRADVPESPIEEEAEETAHSDHALIIEAREWFRKLEAGDPEARQLWQWFVDLSMKDFMSIYQLLGVTFQEVLGESFYEDKMAAVIKELERRQLLFGDPGGAKLVRTGIVTKDQKTKEDIDFPLMVMKSDGASVYATRDLATGIYRQKRWQPAKILYIVGSEQQFYFETLFAVMRKLGIEAELRHPYFGMVMVKVGKDATGKDVLEKMSTRAGRVILLEDLLAEAINRARAMIDERSTSKITEEEKQTIARQIGVGAVKYFDLSRDRRGNITFDWEQMLSLDGNSGPYHQYMVARINSVVKKASDRVAVEPTGFGQAEQPLLLKIAAYPAVIVEAAEKYEPHRLANYLFELASLFSSYYSAVRINDTPEPAVRSARIELVKMVGIVLENGLAVLGIECPERM